MKNVIKPLLKSVLIPLGFTTAASARSAAIQKKMHDSGATLIISNEEMEDIMKIVKSLKVSVLVIKSVGETIKNKGKEQKDGFLSMSFGTLGLVD